MGAIVVLDLAAGLEQADKAKEGAMVDLECRMAILAAEAGRTKVLHYLLDLTKRI